MGLGLIAAFVLCYFAVDRFGALMDKACRTVPASQAADSSRSSVWTGKRRPQESAETAWLPEEQPRQDTSIVLIAADARLLDRFNRETEYEKMNLL